MAERISLGMAVILGNLTNNGDTGVEGLTFSQAADEEIAYLLNDVPRAPNGAISHRESEVSSCSFLSCQENYHHCCRENCACNAMQFEAGRPQ